MASTQTCRRHGVWLLLIPAIIILIISIAVPLRNMYRTSGELRVEVTVLARHDLKILFQIPSITVTQADIQKGSIDISSATQIYVYDNSRDGYELLFEGLDWPFKQVLIHGLNNDVQINLPAAFIHQSYSKRPITAALSYHFDLAGDAKPGEYQWPLSISLPPEP